MISQHSYSKLLVNWLIGFAFLFILTSCSPAVTTGPRPTPTSTHSCSSPCGTITPSSGTPRDAVPGIRSFVDTWTAIHIFQSFDYRIANPASVAKYFDFIWGASVKKVAAFRSANPNIFLTYYIPFHRDNGTFSDSTAIKNLSYWKTVHPDWVLYQCDRITPAYENDGPSMPLDFTNPDVVTWQVQTYAQPASEKGYDGIAADNLTMENYFGACGVYVKGKWVQRYTGQPNDPQWRADIVTWLTRMQQALHHLQHPLALIPNLALGNIPPTDPAIGQVVDHVDGVLDEEGFTNSGMSYLTDGAWLQRVQFMESLQKQNKPYYVLNQFSSGVNREAIQWALASYLMGKEHAAAVFISGYQDYGAALLFDEYKAQIGDPTDEMYYDQKVYWRDYTAGLVVVNPSKTTTYTVTANRTGYIDLYGNRVNQTFTLPPHSGILLLSS